MIDLNRKNIFLLFLGWSGLTILLSAFFLTLLGVVDLTYTNSLTFENHIEFIGKFILNICNTVIMLKICLQISFKKLFFCTIVFTIIHFIAFIILNDSLIVTTLLPIAFILCYIIFERQFNLRKVSTSLVPILVMLIYQKISGIIKIDVFGWYFNNQNLIITFIYSIDLFIFYIFMYCEVKNYVKHLGLAERLPRELGLSFKRKSRRTNTFFSSRENELTTKQKLIYRTIKVSYFICQLLIVLSIGIINNMFIELNIMILMFWIGRNILKKSWHCNKLWLCSVATFTGFYILTKVTPPFEISLFLVVVLTGKFIYLLHILGVKSDRLEELEKENPVLKAMINPEMELRKKCQDVGMSSLLIEICIEHRIHAMSRKQQAEKHGYSVNTIRKYRNDISNMLKSE